MTPTKSTIDEILWKAVFNKPVPNLPFRNEQEVIADFKSQLLQLVLDEVIREDATVEIEFSDGEKQINQEAVWQNELKEILRHRAREVFDVK